MPIARKPLRFLVTAGPTREYLDPVRYLSNDSSGQMGFAVAAAAARRGHRVRLVHGPVSIPPPRDVAVNRVISAAEMLETCERFWAECDVLIMAAAVADFSPVAPSRRKRKKSAAELVVRFRPTVDILKRLSLARRAGQTVFGFALEDQSPRARAAGKLRAKQLDGIVLNAPSAIGAGASQVQVLLTGGGWSVWPRASKAATAARLVKLAERTYRHRLTACVRVSK